MRPFLEDLRISSASPLNERGDRLIDQENTQDGQNDRDEQKPPELASIHNGQSLIR